MQDSDYIPIAALNQYSYCAHRCWRMFCTGEFVDNQYTLGGAVMLSSEGRKTFLRLYEQKKQSQFKHPVLKRQCTYQEAFEIQARLLAKYLMAETEQYPPLILK